MVKESLEKPEIKNIGTGWIKITFLPKSFAQIPSDWDKKVIPDEFIYSPSMEVGGIRNRDRINDWWKFVNYKIDKKETLGTPVGGFGKPVHAFSGTVHYLPKIYKEEHISKAKEILNMIREAEDDEEENGYPVFYRIVDLDERGSYRAHVEDEKGKVVFEYSNEEKDPETGEVREGELWLVADGFIEHVNDLAGLENYLKEMKVIPKDAKLRDGE